MSTVQHVHSGNGNPNELMLQAAPGSHYVDNLSPYELWMTTDGSYWIRIMGDWPPSVSSGTYTVGADNVFPHDVYMSSGELLVSSSLIVASNVAMESYVSDGEWFRYSGAGAFRAEVVPVQGGQTTMVIITTLEEQVFTLPSGG